jgi:protein tyrosine/serine phosphatase
MLPTTPVRFSLIDKTKSVYRGGQPTHEHLQALHQLGIKHVVNLRRENPIKRYYEKQSCEELNINYHPFPHFGIFGMSIETINEIIDAIHNLDEPSYVHCKNGRDRTSVIIASYLVKYCDKDPNLAWEEDVLGYDHDENNMLYSQFKASFFEFCNSLEKIS